MKQIQVDYDYWKLMATFYANSGAGSLEQFLDAVDRMKHLGDRIVVECV